MIYIINVDQVELLLFDLSANDLCIDRSLPFSVERLFKMDKIS